MLLGGVAVPDAAGLTRLAGPSVDMGAFERNAGPATGVALVGTNVPGIWALGECNGRGAFTHTAYNDFEIVAANLLDGDPRKLSDRVACYALFTDPPLGRVGMTEAQISDAGQKFQTGKLAMTSVSRAVERGETQGFMERRSVFPEDARDPGCGHTGTEWR